MKKLITGILLVAGFAYSASVTTPPGVQIVGTPQDNNVLVYSGGTLTDSGVAPTNLVSVTNLTADIEELQSGAIDADVWAAVSNTAYQALAPAYYPQNTVNARDEIELYILGGQSNMEGQPMGFGDLSLRLQSNQPDALFWVYSSVAGLQIDSTNVFPKTSDYWGTEIVMADELLRTRSKVAFAKGAKAGTDLDDWLLTGVAPYVGLKDRINNAKTNLGDMGYNVNVHSLTWMQGETDATTEGTATNYYANFLTFIDNLKTDCGFDELEVNLCRISGTALNVTNRPYFQTVYDAQTDLATSNSWINLVDTDALSVGADGIHFDAAGIIDLSYLVLDSIYENSPTLDVNGYFTANTYGNLHHQPTDGLFAFWDFENGDWVDATSITNITVAFVSTEAVTNDYPRHITAKTAGGDSIEARITGSTFPYSPEFTYSFWMDADGTQPDTSWFMLAGNEVRMWAQTGYIQFRIYHSGGAQDNTQYAYDFNNFSGMVTFSYSTAGKFIYINGKLVKSDSYAGVLDDTSPANVELVSNNSSTQYFNAEWDNISFYNRALSGAEIWAMYSAQARGERPLLPSVVGLPKQAANADTSGNNAAANETEINEIKQTLRALNLMD